MAADAMLGSLARKLRAMGFDVFYFKEGEDRALISLCLDQGRTLLTSDRALFSIASRRKVNAILVQGRTDSERISSMARSAESDRSPLVPGLSRCSLCNGRLEKVPRPLAGGLPPPGVLVRHRDFFRCVACGRIYWKGSHWKKLMSMKRRLALG